MFTVVRSRLRDTTGTQHDGKVDQVSNSRNPLGEAQASRRAQARVHQARPAARARLPTQSDGGTWVMRVADGKGGNSTTAIGTADDFQEADGSQVLDFWQAQNRARTLSQGDGPTAAITVGGALDR